MRLFLAATALMLVLSGCTSQSADDPEDDPTAVVDGVSFQPYGGDASAQPRMRFAAPEYSDAVTYEETFDGTGCSPILTACPGYEVRLDLTPQVPANAPVELAATVITDAGCFFVNLETTETALQTLSIEDGKLAATLVRKDVGTISLVANRCNSISTTVEGSAAAVPVTVEVRTVVRPDVLPPYMPVLVSLAPGDRILAMGASADSIEDLIVVPPGKAPIHLVDTPEFNVTQDMPRGTYIVVVKGAEAMLHGPNVTLVPAPLQHFMGEARDLPSGQTLSWTTALSGVVAYAGLVVELGQAGNGAANDPTPSFVGDFRMTILQGGNELALYERECGGIPCFSSGSFATSTGTEFFAEDLGLGDLEFVVENSMSQGARAFEVIGYVELP